MSKQYNEKKKVLPTLRKMAVGEKTDYPLTRFNTVRASCVLANMQYGVRYSTHIDRKTNTIIVTRVD